MQAKDAIRNTFDMSDMVIDAYLKDLDDADLLVRPVVGMNHIAWQLGHLIKTERRLHRDDPARLLPALARRLRRGPRPQANTEDDPSKFTRGRNIKHSGTPSAARRSRSSTRSPMPTSTAPTPASRPSPRLAEPC